MGNFSSRLTAVMLIWAGCAQAECAPDSVELRTAASTQRFNIEVADTAEERANGLMFRQHLPMSSGMLFVYPAPQHAQFWMKNTLIPLDMVFADAGGTVTTVHENAIPQDLTPIDGGEGVVYVLEINGGLAKRLGLEPGAQMRGAAIDPSGAVWPCDSN